MTCLVQIYDSPCLPQPLLIPLQTENLKEEAASACYQIKYSSLDHSSIQGSYLCVLLTGEIISKGNFPGSLRNAAAKGTNLDLKQAWKMLQWRLNLHCLSGFELWPLLQSRSRNFIQLAMLNVNQSHMLASFCQMSAANSSIIPIGNRCMPKISISCCTMASESQLCDMGRRGQGVTSFVFGALCILKICTI